MSIHHMFSPINVLGYILLAGAIVIPANIYKDILPHEIINEQKSYLFQSKIRPGEEEYCKVNSRKDLPWKFSEEFNCYSIDNPEKSKLLRLEDYKITKLGN